jgi:hypothetical protein
MPSNDIQIHIIISNGTRMATRAYGRDQKGWYCEMSMTEHCDGTPISDPQQLDECLDLTSIDHAVADALMSVHAAFGVMLERGERLPDLVPVEVPVQRSPLN